MLCFSNAKKLLRTTTWVRKPHLSSLKWNTETHQHPHSGEELRGEKKRNKNGMKNNKPGEECIIKKVVLISIPGRQESNLGLR